MTAETNLRKMIQYLSPALSPDRYVFSQVRERVGEKLVPESLGSFRESGGLTLILDHDRAVQMNLQFDFIFCKITLKVHSSLGAVGLLAEVTRVLAAEGIAVNVVSGHDHDHLFVLEKDAEQALRALEELSDGADAGRG